MKRFLIALAIGSSGGWIFSLVHVPLPWTLGPLVAVVVMKIGFNYSITWPAQIRNIAMVILGYAMGRSFTPETGHHILSLLPYLMIASLITVLFSIMGGAMTSRFTGVNLTSSLLGCIPGGLSQMATLCEEIVDADISAITLMQTVRILGVVFVVPFIALHGISRNVAVRSAVVPTLGLREGLQLAIFAGIIAILIYLSRYIKITGRYILPPIIATAVLVLMGMNAPELPPMSIKIAQVLVGIHMGTGVNITNLSNWKKVSFFSLLSTLGLLLILSGMDYLFAKITSVSFLTAFIATAPGGMTEMGLTAMAVQADLSTVISFQLFRLLFILIVAIPVLSGWLAHRKNSIDN